MSASRFSPTTVATSVKQLTFNVQTKPYNFWRRVEYFIYFDLLFAIIKTISRQ